MLCDEKSWDNGNSVWFLMKKGAIWKTQYKIQYNTEMGSISCWNQTGQNPVLGIPLTTERVHTEYCVKILLENIN